MFVVSSRMICILMLSLVCLPVWSAPSGLSSIPTTDVLEPGCLSIEFEYSGTNLIWGDDCDQYELLQVGLGKGIEIGVDRCFNDFDYWFNGKWRIFDESEKRPAIALGIQSISNNDRAQPYFVMSKSFSHYRVHAGVISIDGELRSMVGIDYTPNNNMTFLTDYTNGSENSFTYGLAFNITDRLSLSIARANGNSSEAGSGYIANLAYMVPIH